jgi:cytochrome b subunit of formate dehydrogenase
MTVRPAFLALAFLLVAWPVLGADAHAGEISNSKCFACHDDAKLTKTVGVKTISMEVKPSAFGKSVHDSQSCQDCHPGIKEIPHAETLPPAQCTPCHEHIVKEYSTSIHSASRAMGSSDAAKCSDCHGDHYIVPVKHGDSPVFKMNLPTTCARCHSNPGLTSEYKIGSPQAASQYMESIHGRALLKLGLIVAPSCNDCHGVHNIRRAIDRDSSINHANYSRTCGKCHVGIAKLYDQSVHGQLLVKGDKRVPTCTDCHTAHQIETVLGGHFKAASDKRCGSCHQDRLEHYRETYHGKAMDLGVLNRASEVAACYDCHGHHDVFATSDPRSRLSPANIVQTCKQCHPKATAKFAEYIPHADPRDGKNYPTLHLTFVLMTGLLISVFAFFGIHTVFWLFRSGYLYMHDSKTFREVRIKSKRDDEWFTRFSPFERFLHILVVTSFLLLVITGMPLKFHYTQWAKTLFDIMGGAQAARALHRLGALVTFMYFGLHLIERAMSAWKARNRVQDPDTGRFEWKRFWSIAVGPDSIMPCKQDWDQFIAHQKWFFGKGPRPQFDRWTYWEKFDYLAVFWGVAMIGMSGLVLWFTHFFTRFMPGWIINVALIVHSDEALLAAAFIFTFHFFNVHFRLEKFPIDPVIFSGRISKTEMLHERRLWYDRLVAEGRLDEYRIKDEWSRWKTIAHTFGYAFFAVGVILLILIITAMTAHLLH